MQLRGCWKEDSISSVYEEKREDIAIEPDRWRGVGVGGSKVRQREKEIERWRGVKVFYGVLNGSCIQAAVIPGHPLYRVQLYTPDSRSK